MLSVCGIYLWHPAFLLPRTQESQAEPIKRLIQTRCVRLPRRAATQRAAHVPVSYVRSEVSHLGDGLYGMFSSQCSLFRSVCLGLCGCSNARVVHPTQISLCRPDTSGRQQRRLPPCPLVIALVLLKCSGKIPMLKPME